MTRWRWGDPAASARALGYLAAGVPAGAVAFVWGLASSVVTGVLMITPFGGVAYLAAGWVSRRLAGLERRRAGWVLGAPIAVPYLPVPPGPIWRRVRATAAQPAGWRDLAWLLVLLPVGLAGGVAGIVVAAVDLGAVTAPLWAWSVPNPTAPVLARAAMGTTPGRLVCCLLGLALLPLAAWIVRTLGRLEARAARGLLAPGSYGRLVERAAVLAATRARVVDAQAAELRRIERDLHDGAQARIVAVGMTLALAERKLPADAEARTDLGLARRQIDEALAELRRLVRGIHPPILTDRGLHAALSALAGDSPLPVEVSDDPGGRYPAPIEAAAYFVAAEGLANAAKHAAATRCAVAVARAAGAVSVTVTDNGRGGADATGAGLDGLRRRIEALDGTLTVTSPPGGPTVLHAELPCAS